MGAFVSNCTPRILKSISARHSGGEYSRKNRERNGTWKWKWEPKVRGHHYGQLGPRVICHLSCERERNKKKGAKRNQKKKKKLSQVRHCHPRFSTNSSQIFPTFPIRFSRAFPRMAAGHLSFGFSCCSTI